MDRSPPIMQAIVLAERIYTDQSGRRIICGTFNAVGSPSFPTKTDPSWVFILLVDVYGEIDLQLRFVNLEDNKILMQSAKMHIRAASPLTVQDLAIQVPPLPLPGVGSYSFECWSGLHLLGSVRVEATDIPQENQQ